MIDLEAERARRIDQCLRLGNRACAMLEEMNEAEITSDIGLAKANGLVSIQQGMIAEAIKLSQSERSTFNT